QDGDDGGGARRRRRKAQRPAAGVPEQSRAAMRLLHARHSDVVHRFPRAQPRSVGSRGGGGAKRPSLSLYRLCRYRIGGGRHRRRSQTLAVTARETATLAALAQGRMFANGQHLIASPSLVGCAVGGGRAGAAGPTAESIIEMPLLAQIYSPGVCLRGPSSVATNPSPAAATVHFRAGVRLSRRSLILRVLPRFRRALLLVRFRPSWPCRVQ